jgi:hypothetical protein
MHLLLQKEAPLVLTLLIAAWTWILSEQVKSFDKLRVLEYEFNYAGANNKILFRNISNSQSVNNIEIVVRCAEPKTCLTPIGGFAGTVEFAPPFGVLPAKAGQGDDTSAYYTFSLSVGAAIVLVLRASPNSRFNFTVINSETFDQLTVVESNSAFAWFYRNHMMVIWLLLMLATVVVVALLTRSGEKVEPEQKKALRK